jgi:putative membrane protein
VYDVGEEPDPRFSLANERTYLAWLRTSLAILAGAVALHTLSVPDSRPIRAVLVLGLVVTGALTSTVALWRWARVERAMRLGQPLPALTLGLGVTLVVGIVAIVLAIALVA